MKRNNMYLRNLNHSLMRFKDSLKTLKKVGDEYCLNCECKMDCIAANLHSDEAICLKNDGDVE
jgi:hypothetical protein